ncbi:MAG: FAD-dependent oxidoreductase [Deltaproteobacteria bacterium]|nr:FAD-dependent oxidoreductase [Deltaproteobacteria bacterium]
MSITRPIHIDYPQAVPATYYIDPSACLYLKHETCQICVPVCQSKAIDFSQKAMDKEYAIGAVIMSPGFGKISEDTLAKYGYGKHPDVVTSIEFERMSNASGPFEGQVTCSDKSHPRRLAFIQCVGSRDLGCDNGYCSSVCCMYAIKEAMVAKEHDPECDVTIFYMDIRTQGKDFDKARTRAEEQYGVKFVRAKVADVMPWGKDLKLTYATMDNTHRFETFDMVVLSVGLESPKDAGTLAEIGGFGLNKYDFAQTETFAPLQTSRAGVLVAGAFQGPKDIPESATQSSAAASLAAGFMSEQRNAATIIKEYPQEQEVTAEDEVRIGVFVCHCGINISSTVDVEKVAKYAGTMENVAYYSETLYACSQDAQEVIKEKIKEHKLNRLVMSACSPRTHEPLFQETLKDAGLNRSLFEMVNIRDHCSWVHAQEPEEATAKSMDLVRMGVAKARHITPLPEYTVPVTSGALIVGAGVAGMTAALNLANQGFDCHLIERQAKPGGNLTHIKTTIWGDDPAILLQDLTDQVKKNKRISLYTNTELATTSGFIGNFSSVLATKAGKKSSEKTIDHGVIILATGGKEHRTKNFMLGEAKKVVTQLDLEAKLAGKGKKSAPDSVVMIQCAGSRGDDLGYCSKVCCNQAVKNALKIKEINPKSQVIVLYRDMRTYGYAEDAYRQARLQGVIFIPYEVADKPKVHQEGKSVVVSFFDPILQEKVTLNPEMVVLSVGVVPEGTEELSKLLKAPLTADDFYLEAHVKLRPVELSVDGVYVCGLAHSPKPLEETIVQAQAAAGKAAIPLAKGSVTVAPIVSIIDKEKCIGCGICEAICPFKAIMMVKVDKQNKAETIAASCKCCGICSSRCPTFAIDMGGFTQDQIFAQIAAFGAIEEDTK